MGDIRLDQAHAYYYQVQTQLGVCRCDMAHFVVWTEKELHYEKIFFDRSFFEKIIQKSHHFFVYAVLPELVGRFFSLNQDIEPLSAQTSSLQEALDTQVEQVHPGTNNTDKTWCYW